MPTAPGQRTPADSARFARMVGIDRTASAWSIPPAPGTVEQLSESEAAGLAYLHSVSDPDRQVGVDIADTTAWALAEEENSRRAMEMLTLSIAAGFVAVVAALIGFSAYRALDARIDAANARADALHKFRACDTPTRNGDTTVITVRRMGQQLLTRCEVIPSLKPSERSPL